MKNDNHLDKFIEDLETIKMTHKEKSEMRNSLASFAELYTPIVSPYHHLTLILRRSVAAVFIAFISIGSLSNFASGDALPGDTLYPVKIAHEEFKLATTVDTKKKISYEIKRTEKRIQEATELANQNELDVGTQSIIAQNIKKQATKVKERIDVVKEDNLEEALILNSELKSTIKVNKEALRKVTTTTEDQKKTKEDIVEHVTDTKKTSNSIPSDPENKEDILVKTKDTIISSKEEVVTNEFIVDQQESETIDDYEQLEISSAETLLESIEEEVQDIEAFEEKVTQEIVQEENELELIEKVSEFTLAEEVIDTINENLDQEVETNTVIIAESKEKNEIKTKDENSKIIKGHINALEEILSLEKRINEIKGDSFDNLYITQLNKEGVEEVLFNEEDARQQADEFIKANKYKNAFIVLQGIFEKYQEQNIVKEVEDDFGIILDPIEQPTLAEVDQKIHKEIELEMIKENKVPIDKEIESQYKEEATLTNTQKHLEIPVILQ